MHFLLRCIFLPACKWKRQERYAWKEGKRTGYTFVYMLRLIEYAFRMFDYNKIIQNLRVKKLDLNQLNGSQLFTIYSSITRCYTLRDQTEVLFFQGYSNKKGTDRTKLEKNANQIATTTDARFERYAFLYSAIYIQQICMCVQVPLLFATPAPQFQRS